MGYYMVRSHCSPENRDAIFKRYTANPEAGQNVVQHGDWVSILGDGAYHLMEAEDAKDIADELMRYTDLASYTVEPVIPATVFFELVRKHGLD